MNRSLEMELASLGERFVTSNRDGRLHISLPQRGKEDISEEDEENWSIQAHHLIDLGFHEEIGLSAEEYQNQLPPLKPKDSRLDGRFDLPLLIDPRISLKSQIARMDVLTEYLNPDLIGSIVDIASVNAEPYQLWVQDGSKNSLKQGFLNVLPLFDMDERPLTITEALAFLREYRSLFRDNVNSVSSELEIVAGGSRFSDAWLTDVDMLVSSGYVPTLTIKRVSVDSGFSQEMHPVLGAINSINNENFIFDTPTCAKASYERSKNHTWGIRADRLR